MLREEPDTLWNGLRFVGDAAGRRGCPGSKLALMSTYCVSGALLGLGDSAGNQTNEDPCSCGLVFWQRKTFKKQDI